MKRILISILSIIILIGLGFTSGWFAKTKFTPKQDKQVYQTANDFILNIQSGETDKAYAMTNDLYKKHTSQEEFNNQVAGINGVVLLDGISTLYQNKDSFMLINELLDKDGKTNKIVVVNLTKNKNKVEVTGVSL